MTITFPDLPRSQESFTLFNVARVGGVTLGGSIQAIVNPSGLWRARIGLRLRKPQHFTILRGFLAGLDGQAGAFAVGPIDWRCKPWYRDPTFGTVITPGVARRGPDANAAAISFSLAQPCALNATTLYIARERGGVLQVGQYLQLGDRLHVITELLSPDPPNEYGGADPATVGVTVRPWTRSAYGEGTPVEFAVPTVSMRLGDSTVPDVEMTTSPVGDVTLNLQEA